MGGKDEKISILYLLWLHTQKAITLSKLPDSNKFQIHFSECDIRYFLVFTAYIIHHKSLYVEYWHLCRTSGIWVLELLRRFFSCLPLFFFVQLPRTEHLVVTNTWEINLLLLKLLYSVTRKPKNIIKNVQWKKSYSLTTMNTMKRMWCCCCFIFSNHRIIE